MNLEKLTKKELYKLASDKKIKGRGGMTKKELIEELNPFFMPKTESKSVSSPLPEKAEKTPPSYPPILDYPIPDRYQIDTIVLLPVNPEREYAYWEISDNKVNKFCSEHQITEPVFILKLHSLTEEADVELASIRVGRYGNWFFDIEAPEKTLWAEVGMLDTKGNFFSIVSSRKIKMPSNAISTVVDEETWMTVGEKIEEITKLSGEAEIKDREVESSARFHREILMMLEKNISSSNFQE